MSKKWIIALVLLLAVVVVFAACRSKEVEEPTTEITTELTTAPTTEEQPTEYVSADDEKTSESETLVITPGTGDFSDDDFDSGNGIQIGDPSDNSGASGSISWSEIVGN